MGGASGTTVANCAAGQVLKGQATTNGITTGTASCGPVNLATEVTGTISDGNLSGNVTLQGNAFNTASQLVQLDAGGNLPALNGSALTNLNASNLASGTVADARLSSNVALKNIDNNFSVGQRINSVTFNPTISADYNLDWQTSGGYAKFWQHQSGVTAQSTWANYDQAQDRWEANGSTVATAPHVLDMPYNGGWQFKTSPNQVYASGDPVTLSTTLEVGAGNTLGFYGVTPAARAGATDDIKDALTNYGLLQGTSATPLNLDGGTLTAGTVNATTITGDGSGLTNINASNITSGTLADARLSSNVPLKNANNTFTGSNTFQADSAATKPFIAKGAVAQTGDLAQFQDSSGSPLTKVLSNGSININRVDTSVINSNVPLAIQAIANYPGQIIKGQAGQDSELFQLQDSAGTILTAFDKDGKLVFGPSGAQDTNLYRTAANTLKTDDTLRVVGGVYAGEGTANQIALFTDGKIYFGSATDTNLYRSAADTLRTDDSLVVGTNQYQKLSANGQQSNLGDTSNCCGAAYTLGISELTSSTDRVATLQFHNSGFQEGFFRLAKNSRTFQVGDSQGNGADFAVMNPAGSSQAVTLGKNGNVNITGQYQVNGTQLDTGDLADGSNITLQGNTFNGASQLVQLDAGGALPALSGAALTNLNASNIASGTVADARLSSNVALKNINNNFSTDQTINGALGIGTAPNSLSALKIDKTWGSATAGEQYGEYLKTNYSVADTSLKQGLRLSTEASNTTGTQANLIGGLAVNTSSGNGGTTTNSMNLWTRNDASTGSTITNAYNLYANDGTGAGTIQNQYGVYVNQLSKGTTNNYAIYTAGNTKSYFGGSVGINVASPAAKLDVAGDHATTDFRISRAGNPAVYLSAKAPGGVNTQTAIGINGGNALALGSNGGAAIGSSYVGNDTALPANGLAVSGNVGVGTNNPVAKLQIANNVATGGLDTFAEYQTLLYQSATPATSYGMGIRGGTYVFNSDDNYNFDVDGVNKVSFNNAGNVNITGQYQVNGAQLALANLSDGANVAKTNVDNNFSVGQTINNGSLQIPVANGTDNGSPGVITVPGDDFLYDGEYINHYGLGWHNYNDSDTAGNNAYLSGYFGIDMFTAGSERLRINRNGNVGIGTTSPAAKLQVGANFNTMPTGTQLAALGSGSNPSLRILNSDGNVDYGSYIKNDYSSGSTLTLGTRDVATDTDGLSVKGGNVGIGETNPGAKLTVKGDSAGTLSDNGQLRIQGTTDTNKKLIAGVDTSAATPYGFIQATETGVSYRNLVLEPQAGNVGVGNLSPGYKLDVSGDVNTTGVYRVNGTQLALANLSDGANVAKTNVNNNFSTGQTITGNSQLYASGSTSSAIADQTNWLRSPKNTVTAFVGDSDSTTGYVANDVSGNLRFNGNVVAWGDLGYYPNGGGNGNQGNFRLSLAGANINTTPDAKLGVGDLYASGNVGIGTTSPDQKLSVVRPGFGTIAGFGANNTGNLVTLGYENNGVSSITGSSYGRFEVQSQANNNIVLNPGSGNVGIGTDTPGRKLEVNNLMKFTNASADLNDGVIGTAPFAAGLNIVGINTDAGGRKINTWGSIIQNENPVGNTFAGNSTFNGNVGIGDADPSTKLAFGGTGAANGITLGDDVASPANLYRSAPDALKTDDTFDAASYKVGGASGSTASACGAGQVSNVTAGGGLITGHSCVATSGSTTLQNAYDNSSSPAAINTSDGKNLQVTLTDTTTDGNFVVNAATGSTGAFKVQRNGTDNLTIDGEGNLNTNGSLSAGAGTDDGTLNLGSGGQNITYDATTGDGFLASDEVTAPQFSAQVFPGFSLDGVTASACGSGQVGNVAVYGGITYSHSCVSPSTSMQSSYDTGNTVSTTNARNVAYTLANTTTDANFLINTAASSTSKFAVQKNSVDTFSVDANGSAIHRPATEQATAFQVQKAGAQAEQLFNVDTSTTPNVVTNPSVETNTTGISAVGGATLSPTTSEKWSGNAALQIATTATNPNGASFAVSGSSNTWTISAYVKGAATYNTIILRYNNTSCLTALTIESNGWTRHSCTTPAATTLTDIDVLDTTTGHTLYVDGVQAQTGSTVTPFQIGETALNGVIDSPVALKNQSDSTAAFQVMDNAGAEMLRVDSEYKLINFNGARGMNIATANNGTAGIELGNSANAGTTPYIDFHYGVSGSADNNFRLINDANDQLSMQSVGGNAKLNVQGSVWANGIQLWSDEKIKKDIKPANDNALQEINKIPVVEYKYKKDSLNGNESQNDKTIGVLAQDVAKANPALVSKGPDDTLGINLYSLVSLNLKATQQLSQESKRIETKEDKKTDENTGAIKKLTDQFDGFKKAVEDRFGKVEKSIGDLQKGLGDTNKKVDDLAKRPTVTASGSPIPVAAGTPAPATGTSTETQAKLDAVTKTANDAKAAAERVAGDFKTFTDNIAKKIDELSTTLDEVQKSVGDLAGKVTGVEKRQGEADAKLKQLEEQQKKAGDQSPTISATANQQQNEALQNKVNDLEKKVAETAGQAAAQVSASQNAATQNQIAALQNEVKRLQAAQLSGSGASVEQVNRVTQGSAGPYPTPDLAVPAVGGAASAGGVAAQVQGAGAVSAIGLGGTSDGKLVSDASKQDAFDLSTTKEVKDGNLLVVKNKDAVKFSVDKDGKITSQSVTTASLADKAVTTSKLAPNQIEFRAPAGADIRVDGSDFKDIGQSTEYTAGDTDESLILNARLMAKNDGGQGVGARLVAVIGGVETECNESFTYQSDYSTLAVPCTVSVPAKTKVTIKWQVKVGDGGTAVVFRQTDKASPYINGFAAAR